MTISRGVRLTDGEAGAGTGAGDDTERSEEELDAGMAAPLRGAAAVLVGEASVAFGDRGGDAAVVETLDRGSVGDADAILAAMCSAAAAVTAGGRSGSGISAAAAAAGESGAEAESLVDWYLTNHLRSTGPFGVPVSAGSAPGGAEARRSSRASAADAFGTADAIAAGGETRCLLGGGISWYSLTMGREGRAAAGAE